MRTSGPDTKERIEQAAIRLFAKKGVNATSIRDITKQTRISLGALYNHYKHKDELAEKLFLRSWSDMGRSLRQAAKAHDKLADQLHAMVRYVFVSFDENPDLVTYVYISRHEHLKKVGGATTNPYIVFRVAIVEAMRHGEIPHQDPDLATAMVMGTIVQVMDMKILGRIKPKLSQKVDEVAQAAYRLLGGR